MIPGSQHECTDVGVDNLDDSGMGLTYSLEARTGCSAEDNVGSSQAGALAMYSLSDLPRAPRQSARGKRVSHL